MSRRAAAILLAVLAAAVAALILANRGDLAGLSKRVPRPFLRVTPAPPSVVTAAPGATPVPAPETVRITLYFPDQHGMLLHTEERDIPKPTGGASFLQTLFAELHRGPTREGLTAVIPPKMQLRNAFLLPEGEAVLDLALDSALTFGSDEELTIVGALVDTTLHNVAETSRVRILVNGEPAETLGGHVDLTRPLLFLKDLVATPEVEPEITPPAAMGAPATVTP
jgi:germination protein M